MEQQIAITGNTYPVRSALRELGGVWNKDLTAWMVPMDKADTARELVKSAPAKAPRRYAQRSYGRRYHFIPSGGGCSCEDYPCCGH